MKRLMISTDYTAVCDVNIDIGTTLNILQFLHVSCWGKYMWRHCWHCCLILCAKLWQQFELIVIIHSATRQLALYCYLCRDGFWICGHGMECISLCAWHFLLVYFVKKQVSTKSQELYRIQGHNHRSIFSYINLKVYNYYRSKINMHNIPPTATARLSASLSNSASLRHCCKCS